MHQNILFLQEFTKELIVNSTPKEFLRKLEAQNIEEQEQKDILREEIEIKPIPKMPQIPMPKQNIQKIKPLQIPNPKQFSNYQGLELGRIAPIISNQGVISVECPGPNKFVSVKSMGRMTPTKISLNKEEINSVIEFFSQQAKIPRIGGIFKAIVNNLIITAIDSDVAGPRFIITKIHPQPSQFL